ncbi:hypothetical protein CXZ10_19740 [Pleomorphomonas diazotrophica]|uniref:Uncharacterized protein n=1 Tax=Pleomorphomonas diazotrophica TaxID=1166257 RepID=A0A1I4V528_9HYPH|nr:hypothetical protein [Pleomorphomonas diazotrophica]PKR87438.1 hypothetical protein CXZ10_19740 [Pleomorphomonas diazotrophica]SFM96080.1 hypothetical protein SAMN05192571_11065 [Pleomorphomonas diazotrophica]
MPLFPPPHSRFHRRLRVILFLTITLAAGEGLAGDGGYYLFGDSATTGTITDPDATGVLAQVALFERRVACGWLTVRPEDRFVVAAGTGDILGAMMRGENVVAAAARVSVNLSEAAERLASQGARTILVDDVPDFAHSRLMGGFIGGGPALRDAFGRLSASMREALRADLAALRERLPGGIEIAVIPSNDLFRSILAEPAAYGFVSVTDACHDEGALCDPTGERQNGFLFRDSLRLTERGHAWQAAVHSHLDADAWSLGLTCRAGLDKDRVAQSADVNLKVRF